MKKPIFSPTIFWDIDIDKIDYDAKFVFIVSRVFERGDVPDIKNCIKYYGMEKITEALLNVKFLSLHAIYFAAAMIDRPLTDFRCYRLRQLSPELYPY